MKYKHIYLSPNPSPQNMVTTRCQENDQVMQEKLELLQDIQVAVSQINNGEGWAV